MSQNVRSPNSGARLGKFFTDGRANCLDDSRIALHVLWEVEAFLSEDTEAMVFWDIAFVTCKLA